MTAHRPRRARLVPALLLVLALLAGACGGDGNAAPLASAPSEAVGSVGASEPIAAPSADGAAPADGATPADGTALATAPLPVMPTPSPQLPTTATSTDGTTVEVTDVSRILPLSGGVAEVVFTLGLGGSVVGRDEQATFVEAADLPVVTSSHSVSAEGVLSLAPTVVIGDTLTGPPEALEAIRGAGIPVVIVPEAWTLDDIGPRVQAVAAALGVQDAGAQLLADLDARIDGAAAGLDPAPTVAFLYLRGTAGVYLLGGDGSGADAMIEAAGGIDAGSALGLQPFTPLTSEALVEAAPDVLLVMTKGLDSVGGIDGLVEIPGIAQTPAGQNRDIITVDDGLLLAFGARTPDVIDFLAARLAEWAAR